MESISHRLVELNSDRVESFRFKLMEDIENRFVQIKLEFDKWETTMVNTVIGFEDKLQVIN